MPIACRCGTPNDSPEGKNADAKFRRRFMTAEARPVLKNPIPLYVVGLFSMGYVDFYIFLMPLYCLSLGMSAGEVGLIVGARSALAVFLSIHIGVLMDRFGTRRVTLFSVWTGICLAPVFPLVPWFWPLLLLQIVNGGALSFAQRHRMRLRSLARCWLEAPQGDGPTPLLYFAGLWCLDQRWDYWD